MKKVFYKKKEIGIISFYNNGWIYTLKNCYSSPVNFKSEAIAKREMIRVYKMKGGN